MDIPYNHAWSLFRLMNATYKASGCVLMRQAKERRTSRRLQVVSGLRLHKGV